MCVYIYIHIHIYININIKLVELLLGLIEIDF